MSRNHRAALRRQIITVRNAHAKCMVSKSSASQGHSSAAPNAPVLLRGFVAALFPPLPRPLEVARVELEPWKDALRLKPRLPLVETQGSGQSLLKCPLPPHLKHSTPVVSAAPFGLCAAVLVRFKLLRAGQSLAQCPGCPQLKQSPDC